MLRPILMVMIIVVILDQKRVILRPIMTFVIILLMISLSYVGTNLGIWYDYDMIIFRKIGGFCAF